MKTRSAQSSRGWILLKGKRFAGRLPQTCRLMATVCASHESDTICAVQSNASRCDAKDRAYRGAKMESAESKAEGVRWELGDLYSGADDPNIERDLTDARQRAETFDKNYRGRFAGLDGPALALVLVEYEALCDVLYRPSFYASLL